jgi:hypothetical protein|tara:strand:- start:143 stop:610 length:468 start_codon:yes stop_codon:yes gene_type:complete
MEEKKENIKLVYSKNYEKIILKEISEIYEIEKALICSSTRIRSVMSAKTMFIYILRNMFSLSLVKIGGITKLHHASIIHHVSKYEFFLETYDEEKKLFDRVKLKILDVQVDERIRMLEEESDKIKEELTKLYNIKNQKNVRNERKNLLAKQYQRD